MPAVEGDADIIKMQHSKASQKQLQEALKAKAKMRAVAKDHVQDAHHPAKTIKLAKELSDCVGDIEAAKFRGSLHASDTSTTTNVLQGWTRTPTRSSPGRCPRLAKQRPAVQCLMLFFIVAHVLSAYAADSIKGMKFVQRNRRQLARFGTSDIALCCVILLQYISGWVPRQLVQLQSSANVDGGLPAGGAQLPDALRRDELEPGHVPRQRIGTFVTCNCGSKLMLPRADMC